MHPSGERTWVALDRVSQLALRSRIANPTWACLRGVALAALALHPSLGLAAGGTITDLGDLPGGGAGSFATDVSADGSTVVGYGTSANGHEAFRWTIATGMVGLGDLSGGNFYSTAEAVSADGSVVVGTGTNGTWLANDPHGFIWTSGGGMVALQTDQISNVWAIDADGSNPVGDLCCDPTTGVEAYHWDLGSLGDDGSFSSSATGISDGGGTIVGHRKLTSSSASEAVMWTPGGGMLGLGDLPGGATESFAHAVTPDGSTIIGLGQSASGPEAFVLMSGSGMIGLGDLPGGSFFSFANDITADGTTIVGVSSGAAGFRAIVWDASNGIRDLADVLTDLGVDASGWTLAEATGISDDGRVIVGAGSKAGGGGAWRVVLDDPIVAPAVVPGLGPLGISCLVGLFGLLGQMRVVGSARRSRPHST